jgi:hypothetical protein
VEGSHTKTAKVITVVLVSPGDVLEEVEATKRGIEKLRILARRERITFDLRRWEDVTPGFDPEGAQSRIDKELDIRSCDLLIGIFGRRYGTIDVAPYSRTAREIRTALEARRASSDCRPEVKVYFSKRPFEPQASEDLEQFKGVFEFREELERGKEVIYKEFPSSDFELLIFHDLVSYFVEKLRANSPRAEISLNARSTPVILRHEGYTEPIKDISIEISGTVPDSLLEKLFSVEITVFLSSIVTNRIDATSLSDAWIAPKGDDRNILARGKAEKNTLVFSGVPLQAKDGTFQELFSMRGIRLCANMFMPGGLMTAGIQVTLADETGPVASAAVASAPIGIIIRALRSSVCRKTSGTTLAPWSQATSGAHRVHSFEVEFYRPFPGAFISGAAPGTGNDGMVFIVSVFGVPESVGVYGSSCDVIGRRKGTSSNYTPRAEAINADENGVPLSQAAPAQVLWSENAPLVEADRSQSSEATLTWRLIKPFEDQNEWADEIRFGVTVIIPPGGDHFNSIRIRCSLGPAFLTSAATMASSTLPIPRFSPAHEWQTISLDS